MFVIEICAGGRKLMLHEMTQDELIRAIETNATHGYLPVDAAYAHRWIRDGRAHSTALWIDDGGRVRRAA